MTSALSKVSRFLSPEEPAFQRSPAGWVIVVLNGLMATMSANFFLGMMKFTPAEWLLVNTCAPSVAVFILGFLLARPMLMLAGSVLMFYYGTLGLFVFSWEGGNLIAQTGHVFMTAAVLYTIIEAVRNRRWRAWAAGVTLGVLIWIPFNLAQFFHFVENPDLAKALFSGRLVPPGY